MSNQDRKILKRTAVIAAIVTAVLMVSVIVASAEAPEYWQGYDLGYYHGRNHMQRAYPASQYWNDFLRGYDRGHVDGYYNRPPRIHYTEDFNGGNYARQYPQHPDPRNHGSIPFPPPPPWFRH